MERVEQLKNETLPQIELARGEFETFHERIKELRESRIENRVGFRLKQNEAAFLTDQLPPNYNRVEKGLIKPSIDFIIQISEVFGVTTDFLIKGELAPYLYSSDGKKGKREEKKEERKEAPDREIIEVYRQVIDAKDNQIKSINALVDNLEKEIERLSRK